MSFKINVNRSTRTFYLFYKSKMKHLIPNFLKRSLNEKGLMCLQRFIVKIFVLLSFVRRCDGK